MRSSGKPGDGWLSVAEIQAEFGVQETLFRRDYAPKLPADSVREIKNGKAKRNLYHWLGVLRMWREKSAKRAEREAEPKEPDTPSLELKRYWDAKRSERAYWKDVGRFVSVEDAERIIGEYAALIREGLEQVQRNGDAASYDLMVEKFVDAERRYAEQYEQIKRAASEAEASVGEAVLPEADSDDARIRGE